jgi:hypothetical protein
MPLHATRQAPLFEPLVTPGICELNHRSLHSRLFEIKQIHVHFSSQLCAQHRTESNMVLYLRDRFQQLYVSDMKGLKNE